jgi:hypothetical protein
MCRASATYVNPGCRRCVEVLAASAYGGRTGRQRALVTRLEVDRLVVGHGQHRISPTNSGYLLSRSIGGGCNHYRDLQLPGPKNPRCIPAPLDGDDRYPAGLQPDRDGCSDPTQAADHHVVPRLSAYAAKDHRKSRADQCIDDDGGNAGR